MRKSLIPAISAVLIIMFTAPGLSCNSESSVIADIEDKEWMLESHGESGALKAILAGTEVSLTFDSSQGKIRGNAGCNSYFGQYTIDDSELSIGQIAQTEMYCMEPQGVMEQEQDYLGSLQTAKGFQITDGKLRIDCGNKALIFAKQIKFGPVAQLVRAVDSSKWCVHIERYEMNGMNSGKPSGLN